jgi:competence protein ComEC
MYQATVSTIERPNPGDVARRLRDWFGDGIRRAIPEPEGSLSVGYLVGQKTALSETLTNQLKIVGLTHAVVASGYNLTIIVGGTRRLFARFSKYLAALAAVSLILGFILVTGFSPSMTRAGLVSLLGLATWYYGRSMHPVILLVFSACLTAIWRPAYVWGDIGWYLSFMAFTGVIVLAPLLKLYFWGTKKLGVFRQTLLDTTAAQILTMPIILHAFGQYATYALLANMLVLPLVPAAMLLTFFAGMGGIVLPGFASWFGWPARILLAANLLAIGWVSRLPGASGEINFGLPALTVSYLAVVLGIAYLWQKTGYNFREPSAETELF